MADLVVGCSEVNVIRIGVPRFTVVPPTATVLVENPDTSLVVKNPSLTVTVEKPESPTHIILPVPGRLPVREIFVQPDQPTEGSTAWYWFQTDGVGNLTGNEYVYDPDDI